MAPTQTMQLPESPTDDFPFEVRETIGRGSMGTVFLAHEPELNRPIALKVLRPDFLDSLSSEAAREASQRFLQEARASAALSHPGIVTIHRIGQVNGLSYIAMEWVEGNDLESIVQRHAPIRASIACDIAEQLVDALGAAHERDIVHRDVKPGNVLVQSDGKIKLTDFGIAHVKNSDLVRTQAGEVLGTPLYTSPEQLLERGVDGRSDLFAVGVMLYEMLTGQPPFEGDNLANVSTKIVNEEPTPVSSLNPQVPDKLESIIHRALQKDPARRFASASEMASFLEDCHTDSERELESAPLEKPSPDDSNRSPSDSDADAPTLVVDADQPRKLSIRTVLDWPAESLGESQTSSLLAKLLETPLHAEPFAGGVRLDNSLFLIYQGLIFASVDLENGQVGDHVYEQLPASTRATLFPVPDVIDDRAIPHIASTLYAPDRLHENLDSAYTDIAKLVGRLQSENFSGAVQLSEDAQVAYLFFQNGRKLLEIFSEGWKPNPIEHPWQSWIDDRSVTVNVERRQTNFPTVTYRRELESLTFDVSPSSEGQRVENDSSESTVGMRYSNWRIEPVDAEGNDGASRDSTIWRDLYHSDPSYGLLEWILSELPEHMEERRRFDEWKYLTHWIAEISQASLYHDLPRPGTRESDRFDLVTRDDDGKVLHVGRRVSRLTPDTLEAFIDDVKTAKKARNDRGDIGAAILLADDYTDQFREKYRNVTSDIASWMASVTESITGYEGFVRIGLRRGFHLLPVLENEGRFSPILPRND